MRNDQKKGSLLIAAILVFTALALAPLASALDLYSDAKAKTPFVDRFSNFHKTMFFEETIKPL